MMMEVEGIPVKYITTQISIKINSDCEKDKRCGYHSKLSISTVLYIEVQSSRIQHNLVDESNHKEFISIEN